MMTRITTVLGDDKAERVLVDLDACCSFGFSCFTLFLHGCAIPRETKIDDTNPDESTAE
jgi:hypothetical protein